MTLRVKCRNGCSKQLLCARWTSPSQITGFGGSADFKPADNGVCEHYLPNVVAQACDIEVDRHLINHNED